MAPAPGLRAHKPAPALYRRPAPSRRLDMWFFPWSPSRKAGAQGVPAAASRRQRPAKRPPIRRLTLEQLEDRTVPAVVNWVNAGGGDWDTPSNWLDTTTNTNHVPGP